MIDYSLHRINYIFHQNGNENYLNLFKDLIAIEGKALINISQFLYNFFHLPLNFVLFSPYSASFFTKKNCRKQKIAYNRPKQFISF